MSEPAIVLLTVLCPRCGNTLDCSTHHPEVWPTALLLPRQVQCPGAMLTGAAHCDWMGNVTFARKIVMV